MTAAGGIQTDVGNIILSRDVDTPRRRIRLASLGICALRAHSDVRTDSVGPYGRGYYIIITWSNIQNRYRSHNQERCTNNYNCRDRRSAQAVDGPFLIPRRIAPHFFTAHSAVFKPTSTRWLFLFVIRFSSRRRICLALLGKCAL